MRMGTERERERERGYCGRAPKEGAEEAVSFFHVRRKEQERHDVVMMIGKEEEALSPAQPLGPTKQPNNQTYQSTGTRSTGSGGSGREYTSSTSSGAAAVFCLVRRRKLESDSSFGIDNFFTSHAAAKAASSAAEAAKAVGLVPLLLTVAWVGDCKAVLSRNGIAIPLTSDHNTARSDEKQRVLAAGALVGSDGRVNRSLAVTRRSVHLPSFLPSFLSFFLSPFGFMLDPQLTQTVPPLFNIFFSFGDIEHKSMKTTDEALMGSAITAVPELRELDLTPNEEFLLLASDGLWEVVSPQQAVTFCRRRLFRSFYEGSGGEEVNGDRDSADVQRVAEELVRHAIGGSGSLDNVSVQVVVFWQQKARPSARIRAPEV